MVSPVVTSDTRFGGGNILRLGLTDSDEFGSGFVGEEHVPGVVKATVDPMSEDGEGSA